MRRTFLSLLAIGMPALALDLEPKQGFRELEGARIPMVEFKDGKRVIQWSPPAKWSMAHKPGILSLRTPNLLHAGMEIRVVPRAAVDLRLLSKADTIPQFCAPYLPVSAKNIVYREMSEGAFTIGPNAAREYILEFDELDHPSKASVCVLEYSAQQRVIVVISAKPKDFAAVREEAVQSMFSWREE